MQTRNDKDDQCADRIPLFARKGFRNAPRCLRSTNRGTMFQILLLAVALCTLSTALGTPDLNLSKVDANATANPYQCCVCLICFACDSLGRTCIGQSYWETECGCLVSSASCSAYCANQKCGSRKANNKAGSSLAGTSSLCRCLIAQLAPNGTALMAIDKGIVKSRRLVKSHPLIGPAAAPSNSLGFWFRSVTSFASFTASCQES